MRSRGGLVCCRVRRWSRRPGARRVRDRAETQDLTAHVFHQALANLGKFKWRGLPFAAWLYRIASNAIADQAKRKARESSDQPNASSESSTAADLEEVERRARLFSAVENLRNRLNEK